MHLHTDEWLDLAQRVPVGQKRRVRHGNEITCAMDVWNNEASWSAYCHRCHASGFVPKQFVQKIPKDQPVLHKYLDHKQLVDPKFLAVNDPDVYKDLIILLQDKGVSLSVLASLKPKYNRADKRLVFSQGNTHLGRDCTGLSGAKWLKYYHEDSKQFMYLQGKIDVDHEVIVLCEDLFSCAKITYYTGYSTMCLLGTRFEDSKVKFLLDHKALVLIATDGDKAGWDAVKLISTRCELLGIKWLKVNVPEGLDPKDMKPLELKKLFEDTINDFSN